MSFKKVLVPINGPHTPNNTVGRMGLKAPPGKHHSDLDLLVQKVLGYALLGAGMFFAVGFIRTFGRWIALDEQGFTTSWGLQFSLDQIQAIQLDRWQTKGIAVITLDNSRLVLDDWKYDRKATSKMVQHVQEHLGIADATPDS